MIVNLDKTWTPDSDGIVYISIGFLDEDDPKWYDDIDSIRYHAGDWEDAVPCLQFDWRYDIEQCDVRIELGGTKSWSKIGTNALDYDWPEPTMHLPNRNNCSDLEWHRHIRHEFGHMLGAEHEQFSPRFPWKFDRDAVIEDVGSSKAQTDMLKTFKKSDNILCSEFDEDSIMLYNIEKRWLKKKKPRGRSPRSISEKHHLSDLDKSTMRKAYHCRDHHRSPSVSDSSDYDTDYDDPNPPPPDFPGRDIDQLRGFW
ncbi:hypothetical protein PHISCL_09296 [Aspergillus sclerotialis]|uniref:Peptidase M12A domain-containing protein n=1 Tax=Aspergillus sclerotialis TaxID=2070753 RepID=A0A3A2ZKG3_9EURO|nr:hypothetical protein PHISCL_09296 [Aspergillus sclerotialis]